MTNFEYILNLNIEIFADCVKNYVPSSTNDLWSLSGVIPAEHSTKYPKLFPISLSPELGFKIWLVRNSKRIETDVKSGIILLLEAMQNWNSPFWNNRSDINTWLESDYNANNDSAIWTAILTGYTDALIIPDFTLTAITSGIQVSWVNPILVDNDNIRPQQPFQSALYISSHIPQPSCSRHYHQLRGHRRHRAFCLLPTDTACRWHTATHTACGRHIDNTLHTRHRGRCAADRRGRFQPTVERRRAHARTTQHQS